MSEDKNEILTVLESLSSYLSEEGDDFLENLGDQEWNVSDAEYDDACDAIADSILRDSAEDTLAVISKYIPEPQHIYVDVLKAQVILDKLKVMP